MPAPIGVGAAHGRERGGDRVRARRAPAPCGRRCGGSGSSRRTVTGSVPRAAEHAQRIGHARLAAVPADRVGRVAIVDRHRADADARRRRGDGLEQGRAERQQVRGRRRSCLRERPPAAAARSSASAIAPDLAMRVAARRRGRCRACRFWSASQPISGMRSISALDTKRAPVAPPRIEDVEPADVIGDAAGCAGASGAPSTVDPRAGDPRRARARKRRGQGDGARRSLATRCGGR